MLATVVVLHMSDIENISRVDSTPSLRFCHHYTDRLFCFTIKFVVSAGTEPGTFRILGYVGASTSHNLWASTACYRNSFIFYLKL
jgi:hypothetical protein